MFACFLVFPRFGLPAVFQRTAITLLAAELLALMIWSYGGEAGPAPDAARSAAAIDIPLLSLALVVLSVAYGVIYYRRDEDSRHGLPRKGRLRDRGRVG
jgi:hypothetical protein